MLRMVYSWYFQHVLPWVGRALSGHESAYNYLPSSVGLFHGPPAFCELLQMSGFSEIRAVPLSFGIVYLYVGIKESEFDRDTANAGDEAAIIN
jgi:demethylmenaquinone methyltransferase/2-methoxy-6-polyprenyl-1,4-benzoquinol methylase